MSPRVIPTSGPNSRGPYSRALLLACLALATLAVASAGAAPPAPPRSSSPAAVAADSVALPRHRPDDPWREEQLLTPKAVVRALGAKGERAPLLLHVGFGVLYRGGHIPGSVFAGPGSKVQGTTMIREALKDVPKDRPVILYCGCCPWGDCPNVRPAFRFVEKLGFKNAAVLYLPRSLQQDWIDRGYGVERAEK